jgi:hypothetical protein
MSTLKKLSEEKKALARKMGKLPKAPKKPSRSASLSAMQNYMARYNMYVDKVHGMAAKATSLKAARKQIFGTE